MNNIDTINQSVNEDEWLPFKKRGLHFIHININSLLHKIDEIRAIAKKSMPTIIGITESKIDISVLDEEIKIEGYEILRADRNSFGGGVVCYIKVGTAYDRISDFSDETENVFLNIFLPKSKPNRPNRFCK